MVKSAIDSSTKVVRLRMRLAESCLAELRPTTSTKLSGLGNSRNAKLCLVAVKAAKVPLDCAIEPWGKRTCCA